jgi:GNAT superfamily N-acetyltransferase
MPTIKQCSVSDLESSANFEQLLEEYGAESSIRGMPPINAKLDIYRAMEMSGALVCFSAHVGDELAGFVLVLSPVLPHYGVTVSTTESFFVSRDYRSTGAGLELLRTAEKHAKAIGSPGLLISAPVGGPLEKVLPRSGYVQTNAVFFRELSHASHH